MELQQTELQLFEEAKIIKPLTEILQETKPAAVSNNQNSQTLKKSLDELFPEQLSEEKNIKKAKEILGIVSNELTIEQIRDIVTEMQYLVAISLDNFERIIFEGSTLKELLHEKSL